MTLPLALDTNVLVRLLTNDDPQQAQRVAQLIDGSPACFIPITVTLELEWVLRGAYRLPREVVIQAFEGLLAIPQLHLEAEEHVLCALEWHRQGLDFADALHLARSEGGGALMSFNRALARLVAERSLQPVVVEPGER